MRRYTIAVNGKSYSLDVQEVTADRFEVSLGDRKLDVQLVDDNALPAAAITPEMESALGATRTEAAEPARPLPARPAAPSVPPPTVTYPAVVGAARALSAPMPGTISAIEVEPGARVKRGDVLVSLEAMKMLNAIKSPRDAVVAEIVVTKGQTVAFGDVLVRFGE